LSCKFEGTVRTAFFQLRFTDQFGGEYDTRPIKIDATSGGMTAAQNSNSIQDALEALPNFAIPEIEVDVDISTAASPKVDIYFTDAHNTGQQSLLVFKARAQCEHGSQPKFNVVNTDASKGDIDCQVSRVSITSGKYKESATCANRGICDQSTGRCNCFDGYFGLACDHVNTYI